MNKQLHLIPPSPDNTGRVDNNYLTEKGSPSLLFEPKELVYFETAWDWQKSFRKDLLKDPSSPQAIWMLQHPSCYSQGRGGNQKNVLFDINNSSLNMYRIDRGGDVTHHLPGQLVVYLVLNLRRYKADLHWYLRELEAVIIDLLNMLNLPAERVDGLTGVWCNQLKVASIGIGCRRWITQHGISINVNCEMSGFEKIIPCGINHKNIGKLDYWISGITVEEVKLLMKKCLSDHFDFNWTI